MGELGKIGCGGEVIFVLLFSQFSKNLYVCNIECAYIFLYYYIKAFCF